MVTAKEARGLAKKRRNEIIEEQKQEIEKLILKACTEGEFFIEFQKRLLEEVAEWLIDLGYNIEEEEENEFVVEWEFLADEALNSEEDDGVEEDFDVDGVEEPEEEASKQEEFFFDEELAEENASKEAKEEHENQVNVTDDDEDSEDGDEGDEDDRK